MNDHGSTRSATRLSERIEEIFGLDLRSLALFRISMATMLFGDLAFRLPYLEPLYGERGLLSSDTALEVIGAGLYFTPHFWLRGSVVALGCLFAFQLVAALAMLLGFRTRIATAISWYLLASLQVVENYHLHLGGDTYLRMMLLWGVLLPLGRFWSLDARRRAPSSGSHPQPVRAFSWLTFALISQFLLFYLVAGLHKNTPIWNDGDAVYYMLHRDHLATVFTPMLLEQRWALAPLTYGTYWFEVLGPLLLICPFHTSVVRMAGIVMFVVFHIGLGIFLDIGPYPLMSIAPLAALLPSRFWQEWWPRLLGREPQRDATREGSTAGVEAPALGAPIAIQVFACAIVLYAALFQLQEARVAELPRPLVAAGGALRINQNYKMMKNIGTRSFWLITDGRTSDGQRVDPFHKRPVSLEKPEDIPSTFRSFRWRQFILGTIAHVAVGARGQILHHAFAEYLCREWNAEHTGPERLLGLTTLRGYQVTSLDGVSPAAYAVLWKHECGAPREQDAASMSTSFKESRRGPSEP